MCTADNPSFVVGDSASDPQIQLTALQVDNSALKINDGDKVPLVGRVSQGGVSTLLVFGVRVLNMDICGATLDTSLRDEIQSTASDR